jgi:hypothetical protein
MKAVQECVDHHVREEENEMFPLVEEHMPDAERGRLGRELAARKRAAAPARRKTTKRPAARATQTRRRKTTMKAKGRKRSTAKKASGGRRR